MSANNSTIEASSDKKETLSTTYSTAGQTNPFLCDDRTEKEKQALREAWDELTKRLEEDTSNWADELGPDLFVKQTVNVPVETDSEPMSSSLDSSLHFVEVEEVDPKGEVTEYTYGMDDSDSGPETSSEYDSDSDSNSDSGSGNCYLMANEVSSSLVYSRYEESARAYPAAEHFARRRATKKFEETVTRAAKEMWGHTKEFDEIDMATIGLASLDCPWRKPVPLLKKEQGFLYSVLRNWHSVHFASPSRTLKFWPRQPVMDFRRAWRRLLPTLEPVRAPFWRRCLDQVAGLFRHKTHKGGKGCLKSKVNKNYDAELAGLLLNSLISTRMLLAQVKACEDNGDGLLEALRTWRKQQVLQYYRTVAIEG